MNEWMRYIMSRHCKVKVIKCYRQTRCLIWTIGNPAVREIMSIEITCKNDFSINFILIIINTERASKINNNWIISEFSIHIQYLQFINSYYSPDSAPIINRQGGQCCNGVVTFLGLCMWHVQQMRWLLQCGPIRLCRERGGGIKYYNFIARCYYACLVN